VDNGQESAYSCLASSHRPRHVRTDGKAAGVLKDTCQPELPLTIHRIDPYRLSLCDAACLLHSALARFDKVSFSRRSSHIADEMCVKAMYCTFGIDTDLMLCAADVTLAAA
jgi:hypothetical protein